MNKTRWVLKGIGRLTGPLMGGSPFLFISFIPPGQASVMEYHGDIDCQQSIWTESDNGASGWAEDFRRARGLNQFCAGFAQVPVSSWICGAIPIQLNRTFHTGGWPAQGCCMCASQPVWTAELKLKPQNDTHGRQTQSWRKKI